MGLANLGILNGDVQHCQRNGPRENGPAPFENGPNVLNGPESSVRRLWLWPLWESLERKVEPKSSVHHPHPIRLK